MRWILFCILSLLEICSSQHANHLPKTLYDFEDDDIRGLTKYGDLLAVVLENDIKLMKSSSVPGNALITGSISLEEDFHGTNPVLEFKFIKEFSLLICTEAGCSVCNTTGHMPCIRVPLDTFGSSYSQISAAFIDDKIHLRTVRENGNASISVFEPRYHGNQKSYELVRYMKDSEAITDLTVVGAFSTADYTYFIGSAKRRDIPAMSIVSEGVRNNTDIRITRICNSDKTTNLDSRIDVVLSCEGINYGDLSKTIKNTATASLYIPKKGKLLVAFEHSYLGRNPVSMICEYDFKEIQKKLDYTWSTCQSISDNDKIKSKCKREDNYNLMDEKCFLYTWHLNTQQPFCRSFNGNPNLDNCNLHSNSTSERYGWLENFKAVVGNNVYQSSKPEGYIALQEGENESTLFALNSTNQLLRLNINTKNSEPLLWIPAVRGRRILEIDSDKQMIIFADPRSLSRVNYVRLTCNGLYNECNSISWLDPLECAFCAHADGNGSVFSMKDKMGCGYGDRIIRGVCPPQIDHVSLSDGKYIIEGKLLNNFQDGTEKVTICGIDCPIEKINSDYFFCQLSYQSPGCEVIYSGKLDENYQDFQLKRSVDSESGSSTTSDSPTSSSMKVWRVIGFIVAFILLIAFIIGIYWCLRHRFPKLRSNSERYDQVSSDIPLDIIHSDSHGKLRREQLRMIRDIGRGNTAIVQLAQFFPTPGNQDVYHDVAVKTFNFFGHDGEAMKEIEVMRSCSHPNIVSFIGYVSEPQRTLIVTEYMAGGSLESYLRNPNSRPTIGQCFSFIKQILEGMVYLSHQHVLHRDLATRNCLLDARYETLKISDFGLSRRTNAEYQYIAMGDQRLPFRWLPLEVLKNAKQYDIKSDVWSFGVVVWELFTRGQPPYDGKSMEELVRFLEDGNRLPRPDYCSDDLWNVVQCCWDADPRMRPTFDTLLIEIGDILDAYERNNPDQMNVEYERPRTFSPTTNGSPPRNGNAVMTEV